MPMIPMDRPGGDTIAELLMRQGDAAARAAERSAMLWGNAVSNIGNIAGNAVSQYQDQRQQEQQRKQREMMFDEALSTYDPTKPEDFYRRAAVAVGPELATQASRAMSAFYAGKDAGPDLKKFEAKAQFIQSMWQRDPEWVKQRWSVLSQAVAPDVAAIYNVQIGPQWEDSYAPMIESFTPQATRAQGAPERIKQNGVFFERDPQTGAWSAAQGLPAEVAKPEGPVTGTFEKFVADNPGVDVLKLRQRWAAAGREPDKPRDPNAPLSPTVESTIINRLSNQYTKAAGTVSELSRQVNLMNTGLEAARRGDLAAGSQAVLVTFQKILDPTSVVRESEYARSAEGQALLARIEGAYEKLKSGGAGVPLSELEKYAKLGAEMTKAQMGSFNAAKERIGKTADRYRIPRELVIENMDYGAQTGPPSDSPKAGPKVGERRNFNGKVGVWDGKGWVKQ